MIPALLGTPNQPPILSLPASTRGNAGSSSNEGHLVYSFHCIICLSENLSSPLACTTF